MRLRHPQHAVRDFTACQPAVAAPTERTGTAEVEGHAVQEGPEVELLADELGPVVETDGLWISDILRRVL
jgi:hypothetical protein